MMPELEFLKSLSDTEIKEIDIQKLFENLDRIKRDSWVFVCDMGDLFCENSIIKKNDVKRAALSRYYVLK
jgi:hypothetical protein